MGTQNYLWHFILSVLLCTLMALEGKDPTTVTTESNLNVSRSTNSSSSSTGPAANSSNGSVAEPDTPTAQHSLLGTAPLSPSAMRTVTAEERMNSTPTTKTQEGATLGMSGKSSALPTTGTGTTTGPSMGTETGTAPSPPLSSATTSHSSTSSTSSSSSSSLGGSSAVPPSPQQNSTTGMALTTVNSSAPIEARPSATVGSSTGTLTPQLSSTALPQAQPSVPVTATSPPSSSTATASGSSSATTPAGEEEGSTMKKGDRTTAQTSHSLPATSLVSTMMTVGGEGRTDTAPTTTMSEWGSLGTSPGNGAVLPTFPTAGTGTTAAPESGTASSLTFSSTVMIHSSSSSSSPGGSSAVPPSPQQSSTSSTTGMLSATTSHTPTALVFSSPSSTAGTRGNEPTVNSPAAITASTKAMPSTSGTSSLGSSAVPPSPQQNSTSSTTGMALTTTSHPALVTATSPPSPSTATASAGSSATTPPGEGESSTMNQGIRTEPTANTSHSLPSTSLATPSTTKLSTSTSVNPSTTTTCLTVSIEVQNVTAEEIRLSWSSSSSKGSLYSISVKDGKEINTRTTNETEAVIENLLPGHVYNISVALSSCAESNPASVTVRTGSRSCFERTEFCSAQSTGCSDLKYIACSDNQAFSCTVWLKDETFNNTYYNSDSEGYINMSKRLKTEVVGAMHAELGNNHSDIFILGFRPGSVFADFLFLLPKEEAMDVADIQTRLSNVLRSKFGSKSEVQTLSVQSPTDNISSWRAAVIVLGVLLGVALVLILLAILFYIHVRRRSGTDFSSLYPW